MVAVDPCVDGNDLGLFLVRHDFRFELDGAFPVSFSPAHDAQEPIGVNLIFELTQQSVDRAHEAIRLVGAKMPRIEDRSRSIHRVSDEGLLQIVRAQQRVERRVARHPPFDGLDLRCEKDVSSQRRRRMPDWLLLVTGDDRDRECEKGSELQCARSIAESGGRRS